jgi:hypothetical protein
VTTAIWELVSRITSPGRDHRQNKAPRLLEQRWVEARVPNTDLVRGVGDVELDGASAARLEIDEDQAISGMEQIPRIRLTMEQPLDTHAT